MASSTPSPTTAEFARTRLVRSFQETCAPRQRALLSLLAVCRKHDLDPAPLVSGFSEDLPRTPLESHRRTGNFYWSRVQDFSDELTDVPAIPDGLEEFPGLLPDTVELALRSMQQHGSLNELDDAWLNRPPDHALDATREEPFVVRMIPLLVKVLFVLSLASFVMIYVVPEFRSMLEEFNLDEPYVFQMTVKTMNVVIKLAYVPFLLILLAIPLSFPSFRKYFRRWNPFIWQQPIFPRPVLTRRALALMTACGKPDSPEALARFPGLNRVLESERTDPQSPGTRQFDWNDLASSGIISRNEARALEMTDSGSVQAWLLDTSADRQNHRIESRGRVFTRAVVTTVNIFLGALVVILALSIFMTLITMMSQLA